MSSQALRVDVSMPPEPDRLYRPPAPVPTTPVRALLRGLLSRQRDLLTLMPEEAYRIMATEVGRTRRKIVLVNDPAVVRRLLTEDADRFPKNDLMVGALEPLVGDSVFVSSGTKWRHQRRMIEPAFSHMHVSRAFPAMEAGVADFERRLDALAETGETFSLEKAMSHLTADIICRTIFSVSLESTAAREIFEAFAQFQDSVANVKVAKLWLGRPWAKVRQPDVVLQAAELIRRHIGGFIDLRLSGANRRVPDIAGDVIAARDPETGEAFTREELIDQIGVFFLAGHETTAGALAWTFFVLSQLPAAVERMRDEVDSVAGEGAVGFETTKKLGFVRNTFREILRLYPPLAFIPRVALDSGSLCDIAVPRGAMIMISPWIMHRHTAFWRHPDRFDPDRFLPQREHEMTPNAYLPFGMGQRLCVGAAFAMIESALIIARRVRRYDIFAVNAPEVRPVARLTTRSARDIRVRIKRR